MNIETIISKLDGFTLKSDEKQSLVDWLKANAPALVNVGVSEVRALLTAMQSKETQLDFYKKLVEKMTWDERIQLMKLSAEDLRKETSPYLNMAAIMVSATDIAVKLLPVLLAVI